MGSAKRVAPRRFDRLLRQLDPAVSGSAAGLKKRDILEDLSWVRRTVFEPTSGLPYLTGTKNRGSTNRVEIPATLRRALLKHWMRYGVGPEDLLFPGADGSPLRPRNWRRSAGWLVTLPLSLGRITLTDFKRAAGETPPAIAALEALMTGSSQMLLSRIVMEEP